MTHLFLYVLCFLQCVVSLVAVRYGDYSVGHMPQYNDQQEDSDVAPGHEEYSDRSPDAPAHFDYKYEEDSHGKSGDALVKDIVEERIWDKPIKKKRKPSISRNGHNRDLDKYSLDDTEIKSDKRFAVRGSEFRKGRRSESQTHLKHITIGLDDDSDSVENNNDYVLKPDLEKVDGDHAIGIGRVRYRSTTYRKPRRKARDRALYTRGWRDSKNDVKLENDDVDSRLERENLVIKSPNRFGEIMQLETVNRKNKNNYDYDEYYDMKRVQNMRSRLPALFKQTTVMTTEAKGTSYSKHGVIRRAELPHSDTVSETGVTEFTSALTTTTTTHPTTTTKMTSETKSSAGNSSDLSLAEKSRLSILRKAQRKESSRNSSLTTKPPVLLQVTRKMETVVMVERRPAEALMHARGVMDESPERLRRARKLVRHKLVAGARSINDLIDNWDEMVCDYIDVSLLDTDTASYDDLDRYIAIFLFFVLLFDVNRLF